jgi:hypothetical protein
MRPIPSITPNQNIPQKQIPFGNFVEQVTCIWKRVRNSIKMNKFSGQVFIVSKTQMAELSMELFPWV